jgi:hypothetical protein
VKTRATAEARVVGVVDVAAAVVGAGAKAIAKKKRPETAVSVAADVARAVAVEERAAAVVAAAAGKEVPVLEIGKAKDKDGGIRIESRSWRAVRAMLLFENFFGLCGRVVDVVVTFKGFFFCLLDILLLLQEDEQQWERTTGRGGRTGLDVWVPGEGGGGGCRIKRAQEPEN